MKEQETNIASKAGSMDRKDFMKQVGIGFGAVLLMNCISACSDAEIPDPVAPGGATGKIDFSVNITSSDNANLQTLGGFKVFADEGVIVARTLDGSFIAVASACTHQGTTIQYRKDERDFRCPNHLSEFKENGEVEKGPATSNLKRFNTAFTETSNTLRIFE